MSVHLIADSHKRIAAQDRSCDVGLVALRTAPNPKFDHFANLVQFAQLRGALSLEG
jgi:hypothetical protein